MTRFCKECGAAVTETARFCNKCGVQLEATESSPGETAPGTTYQTKAQEGANYGPSPYQPPAQAGYQSPDANAELKHHTAAMLCYPLFFITGIIFLVLNPYNKDKFVRFNAYQSIFFTVTLLALNIAIKMLSLVLPDFLNGLLDSGLEFIALGGTIWMMIQAYKGKRGKLPIIGDLAENRQ